MMITRPWAWLQGCNIQYFHSFVVADCDWQFLHVKSQLCKICWSGLRWCYDWTCHHVALSWKAKDSRTVSGLSVRNANSLLLTSTSAHTNGSVCTHSASLYLCWRFVSATVVAVARSNGVACEDDSQISAASETSPNELLINNKCSAHHIWW